MKLIETLSQSDRYSLITGGVVGVFNSMILPTDLFYDVTSDLCLSYYTAKSGSKTISPTYNRIIEMCNEVEYSDFITIDGLNFYTKDNLMFVIYEGEAPNTPENIIGKIIRSKYIDKWNRVYTSLIMTQYDVLTNFKKKYIKTGDISDNNSKDTLDTRIGEDTDTITYNSKTEYDGKTGTKETVSTETTNNDGVYGFNSNSVVNRDYGSENSVVSTVGNANDNTQHNLTSKTGEDTKHYGKNETLTSKDIIKNKRDYSEEYDFYGFDGSPADIISKELDMRNKQIFFDIVHNDIDTILTIQIYI